MTTASKTIATTNTDRPGLSFSAGAVPAFGIEPSPAHKRALVMVNAEGGLAFAMAFRASVKAGAIRRVGR
ncbi:MAG: hypothetical protein EKK29_07045 [Hyphomicrobiales bacterium]|nr:MAG: hypothetical protein EKK29_07045 [Hyphomicrobiales bacterium]